MALNATFVKQVPHKGSAAGEKYADGGGMYLLVKSTGKYWRMDYRFAGKRRTLAIGVYPDVSLEQARKTRDKAREQLAADADPSEAKREARHATAIAASNTFELVAREFHKSKKSAWSPVYSDKWIRLMEVNLFPAIGGKPLTSITAQMMLDVLKRIQSRGVVDTAHTVKRQAGQVFRYGIQTGRCDRNPCPDLTGALLPLNVKNRPAILDPIRVGEMLRAFDTYTGTPITKAALILSALVFQRPGNIRMMEWSWINFEDAMLTIPSASMKRTVAQKRNGRPHLVPLAPQAIAILKGIQPITGAGKYVFSIRSTEPMSSRTINKALTALGFDTKEEMTAHGFRAMARTLAMERIKGIDEGCIEAQLAHGKSGPLGSAYDRTEYMEQRKAMMRIWADYLDKLRAGAEVIQLPVKAA